MTEKLVVEVFEFQSLGGDGVWRAAGCGASDHSEPAPSLRSLADATRRLPAAELRWLEPKWTVVPADGEIGAGPDVVVVGFEYATSRGGAAYHAARQPTDEVRRRRWRRTAVLADGATAKSVLDVPLDALLAPLVTNAAVTKVIAAPVAARVSVRGSSVDLEGNAADDDDGRRDERNDAKRRAVDAAHDAAYDATLRAADAAAPWLPTPGPGQKLRLSGQFTDFMVENERFFPGEGFGVYRLPSDPPRWTDAAGEPRGRAEANEMLRTVSGRWRDKQWAVDTSGACAPDGWRYGWSFSVPLSDMVAIFNDRQHLVRRRRWRRVAEVYEVADVDPTSPSFKPAAAAAAGAETAAVAPLPPAAAAANASFGPVVDATREVTAVFEVSQCERYWPISGWGARRLPHDMPEWATRRGESAPPTRVDAALEALRDNAATTALAGVEFAWRPGSAWEPAAPYEYALDYGRVFSRECRLTDCVRRRPWRREAVARVRVGAAKDGDDDEAGRTLSAAAAAFAVLPPELRRLLVGGDVARGGAYATAAAAAGAAATAASPGRMKRSESVVSKGSRASPSVRSRGSSAESFFAPTAFDVVVVESQRLFPLSGWGKRRLPTDRPAFSNRTGTLERPLAAVEAELPSAYAWAGPWTLDPVTEAEGDGGADGAEHWLYASDFPREFSPVKGRLDFVRKRVWRRRAELRAPSGSSGELGDDAASASGESSAAGGFSFPPQFRAVIEELQSDETVDDCGAPLTPAGSPGLLAATAVAAPTAKRATFVRQEYVSAARCGTCFEPYASPDRRRRHCRQCGRIHCERCVKVEPDAGFRRLCRGCARVELEIAAMALFAKEREAEEAAVAAAAEAARHKAEADAVAAQEAAAAARADEKRREELARQPPAAAAAATPQPAAPVAPEPAAAAGAAPATTAVPQHPAVAQPAKTEKSSCCTMM